MNSPGNAGFGPVLAVRSLLSALTVPYWIAGGWAIDLAVGRVTRDHADVDIMLLERDEHALRTDLTQVDVQLIGRDGQSGPWPAGRRLLVGPGLGPRRPIGADRLVLHSKNLPLPAEVLLVSAVGASWVYYRGRTLHQPATRRHHPQPGWHLVPGSRGGAAVQVSLGEREGSA